MWCKCNYFKIYYLFVYYKMENNKVKNPIKHHIAYATNAILKNIDGNNFFEGRVKKINEANNALLYFLEKVVHVFFSLIWKNGVFFLLLLDFRAKLTFLFKNVFRFCPIC